MDYIPAFEVAAVVVGGFILAGTVSGLRAGEVHFLAQWLKEDGYERDDPKFRQVVVANFAIAAVLFGISAAHLIALHLGA